MLQQENNISFVFVLFDISSKGHDGFSYFFLFGLACTSKSASES